MRRESRARGLEVVTVAMDMEPARARPWIEAASPDHPSLLDPGHSLGERLGIHNVPSGVWIDEQGRIVRPPEPAFPTRLVEEAIHETELPADAPEARREALGEAKKIRFEPERYVAALRDWVENGARSRFALSPDEVIRRSPPFSPAAARAAAHFELAQELVRLACGDAAVLYFREAYRLDPGNWTHKREAWSRLPEGRTARELYGSDWLHDVRSIGAENYYPPLDL